MDEKIEILPVELLERHRPLVRRLRRLASSLRIEFGWHYLLDLTWIISHLGEVSGRRILDAGAGIGILQWYLAQQGAEVLSVDRLSRARLPLRFRLRFPVSGLRPQDLLPMGWAIPFQPARSTALGGRLSGLVLEIERWKLPQRAGFRRGRVILYQQDLKDLADIPDRSFDAVTAVSSLEHNPPQDLQRLVAELLRVLKPGGVLLATLAAAKERDWFHEPSRGWCYTEASLRRLFALPEETPSNYCHHDELFAALRDCRELREHLASFYSRSGENGMPWGVWDPRYQPVGVCKVKRGG